MTESEQNAMPESHWQAEIENLKPKQELHRSWAAACCSVTQRQRVSLERLQADSSLGFEGQRHELGKLARHWMKRCAQTLHKWIKGSPPLTITQSWTFSFRCLREAPWVKQIPVGLSHHLQNPPWAAATEEQPAWYENLQLNLKLCLPQQALLEVEVTIPLPYLPTSSLNQRTFS